ncbi:MAG: RNA polymerase sigma factor [Candidatus Omnitrophica bacterium]|nr:RNA polymerase sigma factor [Candidatus Omnitrophota bacterium]
MDQTDEDIMHDFQQGNREAITMIFHRYKNRILNFCLRILGNRADAEDATHDVFVSLIGSSYRYQTNAKFSTWLFTIARNRCIDKLRKSKRLFSLTFTNRDKSVDEQWDVPDHADSSAELLQKKERARHVQQAILRLPYQQREAIVLREYHRFSYDEIAKILNCSLTNVKQLIFRGRERLRTELASYIQEGHHE